MSEEDTVHKRNEDRAIFVKNKSSEDAPYANHPNVQSRVESNSLRNRIIPDSAEVHSMEVRFKRGPSSGTKQMRTLSPTSGDRVVFQKNTFSSKDDYEYKSGRSFQNSIGPTGASKHAPVNSTAAIAPAYRSKNVTICLIVSVLLGCSVAAGIGFGVYSIVNKNSPSTSTYPTIVVNEQDDDQTSISQGATSTDTERSSQTTDSSDSNVPSEGTPVEGETIIAFFHDHFAHIRQRRKCR